MELLSNWFTSLFLVLFRLLFPLFQNPILLTFIAILGLVSCATYYLFQWIKRHKGFRSSGKPLFLFLGALCLELFLGLFWIWYVVIHFWTYKLL